MDQMQFGNFAGHPALGTARYRLSYHDKSNERGTYSFCMCPGGYVLSSGTEADGIVVNGMSNFSRNSPWSNAALVVTVKSDQDLSSKDLLAGARFQKEIEQRAFKLSKKALGLEVFRHKLFSNSWKENHLRSKGLKHLAPAVYFLKN